MTKEVWKGLGTALFLLVVFIFIAIVSYDRGYNRASEEVARASQALLMENCLGFNESLAMAGKLERMDCSLFSDITPGTI